MKNFIAIAVILTIAISLVGCFNQTEETIMPPNAMIWGEVYSVDGNVIRINELMSPQGTSGEIRVRSRDAEVDEPTQGNAGVNAESVGSQAQCIYITAQITTQGICRNTTRSTLTFGI